MAETLSDLQTKWFAEDTGQSVDTSQNSDWISATSAALGAAIGGSLGGDTGPSSADAVFGNNLQFDNSGWNVALGQSSIKSSSDKTSSQSTKGNLPGNLSAYLPWVIAAFVGLVVIKKKKI